MLAGAAGQLIFKPEVVGSYWRQYQGQGIQLDVVAGNQRLKKLFIGEAKWGKDSVSRSILTDLIHRSQRMPQVADGWAVQYALFSREGFTEAASELARELNVKLITLNDMEKTFEEMYEK